MKITLVYKGTHYYITDEEAAKEKPLDVKEIVSAKIAHKYFAIEDKEAFAAEVKHMVANWEKQEGERLIILD